MKKLLPILLVLALLFTLASCGDKKDPPKTEKNETTENSTPEKNDDGFIDFGSVPLTIETEEDSSDENPSGEAGNTPDQGSPEKPSSGSDSGDSGSDSNEESILPGIKDPVETPIIPL